MDVVYQAKKLSMGWCLDCHRNPDAHLRPPELVTQMDWQPPAGVDRATYGRKIREQNSMAAAQAAKFDAELRLARELVAQRAM